MPETIRTPIFTRYELIDELGSGGMGAVYKARQKFVGRLVAFKVLPPALRHDAEALQRFEREASALGRLKHPNVVTVFDAGVEGGFPYLAMEFVEGPNLRQVLQEQGRLPIDDVIRLGIEIGEALDHVQSRGLVHRDVKPSNIIVKPDGHFVLTDFGIAFAATLPRITQGAMGTPEFMSPEQADGKPLDIRSDLYSLGVVLYESLAGAVPFRLDGESLTSLSHLLHQILHVSPTALQEKRPDAPSWLAEIVQRCMAKNVDDRFQTAAALAAALREGAGTAATPSPPAAAPETPKPEASLPEAAPPAAETQRETSRNAPRRTETAPEPPPPPSAGTRGKGWTGAYVYRSSTKSIELDEEAPTELPVPARASKLEKADEANQKKTAHPEKKNRKPRARTAFRIWFVLGLLCFAYYLFEYGLSSTVEGVVDGLVALNVLCLTPALTGALVTLFSRSKQPKSKVGRGLFLGILFGIVLSLACTAAIVIVANTVDWTNENAGLVIAVSATAAAVSATVTALVLGLKSLFTAS